MLPISYGLYFVFLNNEIQKFNLPASLLTATENISIQGGDNINTPQPKKIIAPSIVKAIYVTASSANSKKYITYLNNLLAKTEINSVVVDVKGNSGVVTYKSYDMTDFIKNMHEKGIYLIARIAVFQDSALAKSRKDLAIISKKETIGSQNIVLWKDTGGAYWLDPASTEVQDYNISIAKEALNIGFDEVNFDYIRFPSDGSMQDASFPFWDQKVARSTVVKNFFSRIRQALPQANISVDLFGQTTTSYNDMGIGQVIEDAFLYFDYVCPMVYPSHYASNYIGYKNPAEYPYEIVLHSIKFANSRYKAYEKENSTGNIAKIRPWLQDFNVGAVYTDKMVLLEIKAVLDSLAEDYNGFMLWNPNNIYKQNAVLKQ